MSRSRFDTTSTAFASQHVVQPQSPTQEKARHEAEAAIMRVQSLQDALRTQEIGSKHLAAT